jgi:CheY-like chemotaxis protein
VLSRFLHPATHIVVEAASGEEGILKARAERPDVILLDIALPDINGREVLRRLKSDPETKATPIVIVTSMRLERAEREQLLCAAAGIISKDKLTPQVVNDAVRQALSPDSKAVDV